MDDVKLSTKTNTKACCASHGDPAVIPSESVLEFRLHSPVTVTGAK